jgi:hypothetical protein
VSRQHVGEGGGREGVDHEIRDGNFRNRVCECVCVCVNVCVFLSLSLSLSVCASSRASPVKNENASDERLFRAFIN